MLDFETHVIVQINTVKHMLEKLTFLVVVLDEGNVPVFRFSCI